MNIASQLDQLSTTEKIYTMEYLWNDSRCHAGKVPSISWHVEDLAQRELSVAEGSAIFRDLGAEKLRTRDSLN